MIQSNMMEESNLPDFRTILQTGLDQYGTGKRRKSIDKMRTGQKTGDKLMHKWAHFFDKKERNI